MRIGVGHTRSLDRERVWRTVDVYRQTYWSGLDAKIYAGDVLLDEIVMLQYELQEMVLPLYSYADHVYREAVHGARRVQGAFAINFRRNAWLYELLWHLEDQVRSLAGSGSVLDRSREQQNAFRMARTGSATLEDFLSIVGREGQEQLDPGAIDRVATEFERAIWGDAPERAEPSSDRAASFLDRAVTPGPRFSTVPAFPLRILYGSFPMEGDPARESEPETLTVIDSVSLTGVSRSHDDSGRPILETYTFVARDVR